MARDFKIELDNVEMINGSDDLLKDTKVTKVTITGENKLNSLNSTFENCTELTAIEGEVNLDGISDMTEMALNTTVDEIKVTNPTEENIQANDSLNQIGNVKIGGTKYSKGGVQDVVGSLEWNAENFTYEDTILDNVYANSSSIEDNKNITVSDTLEQKATSFEVTGQTYMNLVDGKSNQNLLDEMSMQQTEGKPTQFTPHTEQPICLEYIKGETYQNLIEGKGEYKLTDTINERTISESEIANGIENLPSAIEITSLWGNTYQNPNNLNEIVSLGDLYVDEEGNPILDEEGNEQYKLELISSDDNGNSNKTTILIPQPLRKVGDICDKLYWDSNENKYIVNQRIIKGILDGTETWNGSAPFYTSKFSSQVYSSYTPDTTLRVLCDKYLGLSWTEAIQNTSYSTISNIRFHRNNNLEISLYPSATKGEFINSLTLNPATVYFVSNSSQTIETKILEKPSLETYLPKTYISTNTEVQPSQMSITNKEVKFFPLSLQPSKSYTIQLDSVGKDNKPITVNLGGTTTTIQPTNDTSKHHRTSITTPSELATDNLDLSGEGVVVNDVMLFEGNTSAIKQDVDYIDGIQSIGELIENKNLFDYTQSKLGFLSISTGGISSNTDWKYTTNLISVKPNTTYCISQTSNSEFYYNIVEYNSSQSYLKGTSWEENSGAISNRVYNTFTTSSNTYYIRLGWKVSSTNIQLEEGLIPTEFRVFGSERYKIEIETYDSRWDSI